jgi:hypothetical protein
MGFLKYEVLFLMPIQLSHLACLFEQHRIENIAVKIAVILLHIKRDRNSARLRQYWLNSFALLLVLSKRYQTST